MIHPDYKWIMALFLIALGLTILVGLLIPPVHAAPWVEQGSSLNQSSTYDLRGVYGFSGKLAWWKNWYDEGADDIEPDKIIDLNTKKNYAVFIDPVEWNVGNWYQWDGVGKNGHGNTFAFRVNYSQGGTGNTTTSVPKVNNVSVIVSAAPTAPPTPTATAVVITVPPTTSVPTPTPSPKFKRTPLPIELIVLSVFGAVLIWRKYGNT